MPANSYSLPESLRPGMPVAPAGSMGFAVPGKLGQLVVSQGRVGSALFCFLAGCNPNVVKYSALCTECG